MYRLYNETKIKEGILPDSEWNGDESGYRVGVASKAHYVWTYVEITDVQLEYFDEKDLVTVVEAISASGKRILPYIIVPRALLKEAHCDNQLRWDCDCCRPSGQGEGGDVAGT